MEKLGIDPIMLLTQIFNFVVLTVVLTKFLYRPVIKIIDERKKKIEEGLQFSEQAKVKMEQLEKERERVLGQAHEEARRLIEEAKKKAKVAEAEIIFQAQEEARLVREKVRQEQEAQKKKMWQDLEKQVLTLAGALAKTMVSEFLDKKTHLAIIDKKIKALEKTRHE